MKISPLYLTLRGCCWSSEAKSQNAKPREHQIRPDGCWGWDLLHYIYVYRISLKKHCNICCPVGKWPHPEMPSDPLPGAESLLQELIRARSLGCLGICLIQSVMYRILLTNPPSPLQFNFRIWHWCVFCVFFCHHTHKLGWNSYREMRGKSPFWRSFAIAKRTFPYAKQKNSVCPTGKTKVSRTLSQ